MQLAFSQTVSLAFLFRSDANVDARARLGSFVLQATPATRADPAYLSDVTPPIKVDDEMDLSDEDEEVEEDHAANQPQARGDATESTSHGPPRVSQAFDSDEDGQEPDTEKSEVEDLEEVDDHDVDGSAAVGSSIVDLMNRSRLETRSPTFEPELWTGIFSPYTAFFDTEVNAQRNKLAQSVEPMDVQSEADKR